jgi:hypothetical protein
MSVVTPRSHKLTALALVVAPLLLAGSAFADYDHSVLDAIVKKAVKGRYVAYDVVAKERPKLQAYIKGVATADISKLSKVEKLAFYTNAYNAIVLEQVLVHERPASVLKVKGFFDGIKHTVAGEQMTLNDLEGNKIRSAGDPRVHFVVNCASDDCPPLAPFAYTGKNYSAKLEAQTKAYLTRKGATVVDDKAKTVEVVQLFEWYEKDWGGKDKAQVFIETYVPAAKGKLSKQGYKLTYRAYDWDLNKTR